MSRSDDVRPPSETEGLGGESNPEILPEREPWRTVVHGIGVIEQVLGAAAAGRHPHPGRCPGRTAVPPGRELPPDRRGRPARHGVGDVPDGRVSHGARPPHRHPRRRLRPRRDGRWPPSSSLVNADRPRHLPRAHVRDVPARRRGHRPGHRRPPRFRSSSSTRSRILGFALTALARAALDRDP